MLSPEPASAAEAAEGSGEPAVLHSASFQGAVWAGSRLECATSAYLLGDGAYYVIISFFTFKIISSAYRQSGLIMLLNL